MSRTTVGFTTHIQVENLLTVPFPSYPSGIVDEKAALTRDFVRGANGSHRTPYYIWIPYIFIIAALCTYLPAWLWHVIGHRAAFDIPAMINQIAKTDLTNTEDRQANLLIMAKHYDKSSRYSRVATRLTDNFLKRLVSICMFFAGGGVLTGTCR